MIGDTFEINGKTFVIKNHFTLGDKRKINSLQSKFNDLVDSHLETNELIDEQLRLSQEQDELMADLLSKILGLTIDDLEKLSYPEEVTNTFKTMIQISTVPKKKESKQSDSPLSQETQISNK